MDINALLLCNSAEVRDDMLFVDGGGWDQLAAQAWPAGQDIQVVALMAPSDSDVGVDLPAVARVLTPEGQECGRTEATLRLAGTRHQVPVVLPVFGGFETAGVYQVAVSVGEAELRTAFTLTGPSQDVRVVQPS